MSQWWMLTGPYFRGFKRLLKAFVLKNDIHDWAYCMERGTTGYEHVHIKLKCSASIDINTLRAYFRDFHCELSNENIGYLRKGGTFVSSMDTTPVRAVRFGKPRPWQVDLIEKARQQSDRAILVLVDEQGALGKSWLVAWMIENRYAYFVPPTISDTKDMIQYIASGYDMEEFIVIDIPRSWKWTEKIATVVETVKDGFVYDTRYSAKWRHIRGVKVIVFTNVTPPTKALSADRWDIINAQLYRNTIAERIPSERNSLSPLGDIVNKGGACEPPPNTPSRDGGVSPPPGPPLNKDKLIEKYKDRIIGEIIYYE